MSRNKPEDIHAARAGQPCGSAIDHPPLSALHGSNRAAKSNNHRKTARSTGSSTTDHAPSAGHRKLRCAIYTRVSSDSGLEQDFNSLDAQREAAEAYIRSQAHEGWQLIRTPYNDGGFSGGSMERPALQQLLEAVQQRRIDIIIVYKVDRLTRSLADFAKLVELFDAHGVSFVSVTQSFNTTTSMGRLTLNVLLSFAQFEREVTGERIRDKIAASKKKGIWMGGPLPFGYRVEDRKLHIVEDEAATIRTIFAKYLEVRSIPALQQVLADLRIQSRIRNFKTGRTVGGNPIRGGALQYLLRNRHYIGELNHRGRSWPGDHPAIIDQDIFDQVQNLLDQNLKRHVTHKRTQQAFLAGLLFDDRGNRMQRSWTIRNGQRSFYYVSKALMDKRRKDAGSVPRINAVEIDGLVREAIKDRLRTSIMASGAKASEHSSPSDIRSDDELRSQIYSVVLHTDRIDIAVYKKGSGRNTNQPAQEIETVTNRFSSAITSDAHNDSLADKTIITLPWQRRSPYRKYDIIPSTDNTPSQQRPMRIESHQKLIANLTTAHAWLNALIANPDLTTSIIAQQENKSERSVRMILSLAFVAPGIVEAALARRLPRGFHTSRFTDLPMQWSAQRTALGLPVSS